MLHGLHGDMLKGPVESLPSGAQVGAGKPPEGKLRAVSTAPDSRRYRRDPHSLHGCPCFFYDIKMLLHHFQHIPIVVGYGEHYRTFPIFFIE